TGCGGSNNELSVYGVMSPEGTAMLMQDAAAVYRKSRTLWEGISLRSKTVNWPLKPAVGPVVTVVEPCRALYRLLFRPIGERSRSCYPIARRRAATPRSARMSPPSSVP